MKINLTETQYKVLLRALAELESVEGTESRNDVFAGDKLRLLSKTERKAAKKLDADGYEWNFTATAYLTKILKKQNEKQTNKKKQAIKNKRKTSTKDK